jgi:hypothetical protein
MARAFDDGASQYLAEDGTPVDSEPLSMGCWFNSDDLTAHQVLMAVYRHVGGNNNYYHHRLMLRGASAGDPVAAVTQGDTVGFSWAATTTGYSANTWHYALGVWAATDDRRAYIDGGSKGTDAVDKSLSQLPTAISVGRISNNDDTLPTQYMSGFIADPVIWNVALTDRDAEALLHVLPWEIRPSNIVDFLPLRYHHTWDRDISGRGYHLTPYNSPTWAPHPQQAQKYWFDWERKKRGRWPTKGLSPIAARIPRHPAQYNPLMVY